MKVVSGGPASPVFKKEGLQKLENASTFWKQLFS